MKSLPLLKSLGFLSPLFFPLIGGIRLTAPFRRSGKCSLPLNGKAGNHLPRLPSPGRTNGLAAVQPRRGRCSGRPMSGFRIRHLGRLPHSGDLEPRTRWSKTRGLPKRRSNLFHNFSDVEVLIENVKMDTRNLMFQEIQGLVHGVFNAESADQILIFPSLHQLMK